MFKEILQIIPTVSSSDLNKMENSLSKRFTNVAKKFSKGLTSAVGKGFGVAGAALGIFDKLLNPLQEVQAAIEKSLAASDDLVTNAKQFGTSAGNLAKLQAFGKAAGLDPDALNTLLAKFQTSVAEAAADPKKQSSVRNFVGQKDTAAAFFEFIQSLQKMEKNQQVLVQQDVFGEKQILKMSDFLNSDFADVAKSFKNIDTAKLNASLEKQGALKDRQDTIGAARDLKDMITKGGLINSGTINSMENSKAIALQKENERIANFQSINNLNDGINKISENLEKLATDIFTQLPIVMTALNTAVDLLRESAKGWAMLFKLIKESRLFKGIKGWFGGSDE